MTVHRSRAGAKEGQESEQSCRFSGGLDGCSLLTEYTPDCLLSSVYGMKGKLAPGLASTHIASARGMSSGHGRNRSEGLGVSGRWVVAPESASSDWPAAAQAQPLFSRRQCSKQAGVRHPSTEDPPVGRDAGLNISRFALRT
ncbi:hypothetical protein TEQG_04339 [Trichophyton equinum CBS 127.97]|uniref:Uncharacterized protein n=1 Tax=Trichophyton equinum (strain ATCC MYA-4606 / CBS 127.97) TaxID=559882 RepID=F2PTG3_TRIEC|nr:hypothetical protein TEQG_04339 [Trichophyton equinum CBS 127.97]